MSLTIPALNDEEPIIPKHFDQPYTMWGEEDVKEWLRFHGLGDQVQYFEPHSIDGEVLPFLTEDLLVEMGIDDPEMRATVLTRIEEERVRGKVKVKFLDKNKNKQNKTKQNKTKTKTKVKAKTKGKTKNKNKQD